MKILVVEDDPETMQRLLNTIVVPREEDGVLVTVTSRPVFLTLTNSMEVADKLVMGLTFDIIFIDHSLRDGIVPEYLEKWRNRGRLQNVSVVAISTDDSWNVSMLARGANISISRDRRFEQYVVELIEAVESGS